MHSDILAYPNFSLIPLNLDIFWEEERIFEGRKRDCFSRCSSLNRRFANNTSSLRKKAFTMKFIILLLLLSLSLLAVKAYDEESIDEEIYDQQEEQYLQPPPQQQHQQQQVRLTPEMLTALLVCNCLLFFQFIHSFTRI